MAQENEISSAPRLTAWCRHALAFLRGRRAIGRAALARCLWALLLLAPMAHADCPVPDVNNPDCIVQPPMERDANPTGMSVPTVMQAGQYYPVMVKFLNTGAATWTAAEGYKLGSAGPQDNGTWGVTRVAVPASIEAQQESAFHFTVRAPQTPGRYTFQWRMLMEGVEWFGPDTSGVLVDVYGGSISASPTVCTIPWGGSNCPSTISWNSNAPNTQVWYSQLDGSGMTPWTSGQNGSLTGGIFGSGLRFYLRSGAMTLATVDVATVPTHNGAPSVTLTAPAPNHIYQIGAAVRLAANASDPDDGVQRVEFLVNGTKVGEDTSAPYQFDWTGLDGGYTVTARAFDTRGAQVTSAGAWIVANGRPQISLTSPANGARATEPANFVLRADASDVDGVHRVEFYADNVLINVDTVAPYEFTWPGAGAGAHAVHAIVHDVLGASTRSANVNVGVDRLVTGPVGVSRRLVYDAQQRLCKTIEPETGATVTAYDEVGNVAWTAAGLNLPDPVSCNRAEAAASGRVVTRGYDGRDRLQTLVFPDGRGNQSWSYYPDGLAREVVTDNDGPGQGTVSNTYAYNRRRLLTAESVAQAGLYRWDMSYGYDNAGQLRAQTYPSGLTVDFGTNALGQPTQVASAGQAFASNVRYHPNGAIASFNYGNGRAHAMSQNARQLPATVDNGAVAYVYEYDANGNTLRVYEPNGQQGVYGGRRDLYYDKLDRLSMADLYWHKTETYAYDALDNIKTRRDWWSGAIQNYWYDDSNRLTNVRDGQGASVVGLGYGPQGNLENKNGQAYVFDFGNRLRAVVGKEVYRYDAYGRRTWIQRVSDGWTDGGIYSQAGQLLYEWKNRSGERNEHLYLGKSLLATRTRYADDRVAVKYQHIDLQGSPLAVSDEAGQVTGRTLWEPWGGAIGKPAYDGLGYTGHVMDGATGLTHMQQRYYDQNLGRFLSVDPVTAFDQGPKHFNRYAYAYNNPYTYTDPDGRCPMCAAHEMINAPIRLYDKVVDVVDKTDVRLEFMAARGVGFEGSVSLMRGDVQLGFVPAGNGRSIGVAIQPREGFSASLSKAVEAPMSFNYEVSAGNGLFGSLEGSLNPGGSVEAVPKVGFGWGASIKYSPSIMFLELDGWDGGDENQDVETEDE